MSSIKVNSIVENTADNGVTVDGVLLKDGGINIDTLSEKTSGSGVTIDGVLLKDGQVAAAAGGAMVKLASATASNSSELTFDNFVDQDTYCQYIIVFQNIHPASDNVEWRFAFRQGGASGSDITGTYRQAGVYYYGDTTGGQIFENNSNTNYQVIQNAIGNSDSESMVGDAKFYPATGTAATSSISILQSAISMQRSDDLGQYIQRNSFFESGATAATGLRFYFSSGNIESGTVIIFGVKK